jgi:DNA-binding IclR family transcriptional regulator
LTELETIKKQGHALDNEEFFEGMVALAVPIYNPQGRYHASVAFHGPTLKLPAGRS